MAISKDTKHAQVAELTRLLSNAKATAFAAYTGLSVAEMQQLRRSAREAGVTIKVVKNRLVSVAMQDVDALKKADVSGLKGQLLYALSAEDEIAPAQTLAAFAKTHDALKLAGGFSADGVAQDEATVKALANLPSKEQLRGMLLGTIASPLSGFMAVANGAQRGFVQVLKQKSEASA
jgi:large subunit ribosomal protein L10